jgi:hypothetical protein
LKVCHTNQGFVTLATKTTSLAVGTSLALSAEPPRGLFPAQFVASQSSINLTFVKIVTHKKPIVTATGRVEFTNTLRATLW